MNAAQRDERTQPPAARVARSSSSPRSRASRASSRRRRRTRRIARSSCGASRRATSSSSRAAFRDKTEAEIKRRRGRRRRTPAPPASSRRRGRPGRQDPRRRAQEGDRVLHARIDQNDYPNYSSRLDEVLYYLAYEYEQASDLDNARKVYYELIQKRAAVEVHPERVPRVRRALLQRGAGRSVEVGRSPRRRTPRSSSTRRRTTRSTATPGTSSRYVYWNKGDFAKALNAFKKTIEYGVAVRAAARTPRSSPTARAATSSRSTRSRAIPTQAYNFFHSHLGRQRRANEQDVQDDGRPRSELPRHRSLPGGASRSTTI